MLDGTSLAFSTGPPPKERNNQMTFPRDQEPPRHVWYSLEEALELLAVLEDAADALTDSGHLAVVMAVEAQVRDLNRRLDFDDPDGGTDAR